MKLTRSNESCRMVSCSPALPSRISSCATSPRSRTECTRTPSTSAPRAPSSACVVASGHGPSPAAARAAAIAAAVCRAVPDGASTLSGWCSSIDLDGLEPAGGLRRERHRQHGAEREVRGDQHADAGPVGQVVAHAGQRLVVPAGGADDQVDPGVDERVHVALGGRRDREVDGDLRTGVDDRRQVLVGVDRGDQLQVGGLLHGADDRLIPCVPPHPARPP